MNAIERLMSGSAIIYVAGRLFDIAEKMKSEDLETAVLAGFRDATPKVPEDLRPTFVPFRDSGQDNLIAEDKTRMLFEMDLARLRRTILLVSYIDGLAKDEGICFEIGYAYASGAAILLISTDFFDIGLPNGQFVPFDPLLTATASHVIRRPRLAEVNGAFIEVLAASRHAVMDEVQQAVAELLAQPPKRPITPQRSESSEHLNVIVDFGGFLFEWQGMLYHELARRIKLPDRVRLVPTTRYDASTNPDANASDLDLLTRADILITCTDADEAPSGTAVLQGVMCGLGKPVWMYNSKRTTIWAPGGYQSSRNLMLDCSANRTFHSLDDLAEALRETVF